MKNLKLFFGLCLMIMLSSSVIFSQAVGDYGSKATGNWGTTGANWVVCQNPGTWVGATDAPGAPTSSTNVWIRSGHTVTVETSPKNCNNLVIESNAKLWCNVAKTTVRYLRVYGNTVTNNGEFGGTNDGLSLGLYSSNLTITGSGVYGINRIQPNIDGHNLTFDADALVTYAGTSGDGGSAIYNNSRDNFTVTINSGKTVTMAPLAYISVSTSGSNDPSTGYNITLNINGTLTTGNNAHINLRNASGKTSTMNVNGTLNFGGNIVAGGSAIININVNNGGSISPALTGKNIDLSGTGTTLTLGSTGTITVGQNNFLLGNPILGTSTNINADATSSFTITGTAAGVNIPSNITALNNLTLNNSNGTILQNNLTVNGTLTLTSGKFTLGNNNLTVASLSGGSASAYVVTNGSGELIRTISTTGSYSFPVGDATNYTPATFNFASGTFSSAYAGVKVVPSKHPQNLSTTNYLSRYWSVSHSGISDFSCNVEFIYVQDDVNGTESEISLGRQISGTLWEVYNLADPENNKLTGTLTALSDFTGGEANVLPVQLASFIGYISGNVAKLEWETISEINNFGFNVQRLEGNEYVTIGFVAGMGTTLQPQRYEYIDENPGTTYRLEQIDNNGLKHYFGPIMLNPNSVRDEVPMVFALYQNYPNPFNPVTNIKFSVAEPNHTTLKVYDALGKVVATLFDDYAENGRIYNVKFDGTGLGSGVYYYKLQSGNNSEIKKLLLMK